MRRSESRYRVFIVDEAHGDHRGIQRAARDVEEPREHLIFIFATTEAAHEKRT